MALYELPPRRRPRMSCKEQNAAEVEMFRELRPALIRALNSLPEESPWWDFFTKIERLAASFGDDRPLRGVED